MGKALEFWHHLMVPPSSSLLFSPWSAALCSAPPPFLHSAATDYQRRAESKALEVMLCAEQFRRFGKGSWGRAMKRKSSPPCKAMAGGDGLEGGDGSEALEGINPGDEIPRCRLVAPGHHQC